MSLPNWFEFRVGFTWLDCDGAVCVLLGWEPEAFVKTGSISVCVNGETHTGVAYDYKPRMTYSVWHNNTWCMYDLDDDDVTRHADMWQPLPDGHPHAAALMTRSTNKYQRY